MPIHHVTYAMQEMHKGNYTYATTDLPHKNHKPPAPRGEAKRARHYRQKSKGAQNSRVKGLIRRPERGE
jgi:hypothetical protein